MQALGERARETAREQGRGQPKDGAFCQFLWPCGSPQEHTTISLAPTAEGLSTPGDGDGGEVKREGNRRRSPSLRNQQQDSRLTFAPQLGGRTPLRAAVSA
jgi:hypothetical protein